MEFWQAVESRHSLRDFSDETVDRESLDRIVRAAAQAPSAHNTQPWHFHISTGESRERVGSVIARATMHMSEYMEVLGPEGYEMAMKWYSDLGGAPAVIGVSMPRFSLDACDSDVLISVGCAIENMLLAATAQGLGACNITVPMWVHDDLDAAFEVPDDRTLAAVVAIGHPGEGPVVFPPKNTDVADWLE